MMTFAGMTPKRGHDAADCEDHFSTSGLRFAVADGASDSGYSQVWARMLADSFCGLRTEAASTPAELDAWLAACRDEWRRWAGERAVGALPWFARETLRTGAFATFVGVAFSQQPGEPSWHAVACGDACMFVVRDDTLASAFPLDDPDAFDDPPPLVPTAARLTSYALQTATGTAEVGDSFYLVTDALARWFLAAIDRGEKPWTTLNDVRTAADLDALVSSARDSRALKNDDVTLMTLAIVGDA
jgi:protein phosphatase 2C-like protein